MCWLCSDTRRISDQVAIVKTSDRLIAAAFKVVARDGLDRASVKKIGAEAGITPSLLHYHFPTLDALLEAALRQALDDYLTRSRARRLATPPSQQIEALFAETIAKLDDERAFFSVRLAFAAQAIFNPVYAATLRDLNAAAVAEIAETLRTARGANEASQVDLVRAASLKATFDGLMLAWLNDRDFPILEAGAILKRSLYAEIGKSPLSSTADYE
jgi:AcrR family transcriptional regulator